MVARRMDGERLKGMATVTGGATRRCDTRPRRLMKRPNESHVSCRRVVFFFFFCTRFDVKRGMFVRIPYTNFSPGLSCSDVPLTL